MWREIVAPIAEDDLELTARERQWLTSACKLLDRVTQLEKIMDDESPISEGYKGQPVVNGLLNEIRQHHQLIGLLLARLDLTDGEEGAPASTITISSPGMRSVKARDAANKRWRK